MKTGIIFDVDGTLMDATVEVTHAWNLALAETKEFNISITREDIMRFMGHPSYTIGDMILPTSLSDAQKREIVDRCLASQNVYQRTHSSPTYENVIPVIRELKKSYNVYIVSNCPHGYIENLLLHTGLADAIDDYEYHGRTGLPKRDNIKLIIERNGIDKAVYVGDTDADYLACKAAGVPFIHAAYGYGTPSEPTPSIKRFDDLPKKIKEVLAK
ncbi:MAG: HAD family hydrolase [Clostridia bacterium]|nr:HAD family hydrolase [Clostridia bacterium]